MRVISLTVQNIFSVAQIIVTKILRTKIAQILDSPFPFRAIISPEEIQ